MLKKEFNLIYKSHFKRRNSTSLLSLSLSHSECVYYRVPVACLIIDVDCDDLVRNTDRGPMQGYMLLKLSAQEPTDREPCESRLKVQKLANV